MTRTKVILKYCSQQGVFPLERRHKSKLVILDHSNDKPCQSPRQNESKFQKVVVCPLVPWNTHYRVWVRSGKKDEIQGVLIKNMEELL